MNIKIIAFVDDDKRILDGVRRMLHRRRKEWDMHFFESGSQLLNSMQSTQYDVIVSDIRMPVMNGAELLTKVREISPKTIRIVLSGYPNEELVLESIHATHQFIAKPADQETLISHIDRALQMQPILDSDNAKRVLGGIDSVPTLPAIYDELMVEVSSENMSIKRVAQIVSSDIGLSASILRVVNSAFFGLVREVNSLEEAASILGIDMIKNLALMTKVFSSFTVPEHNMAALESLNRFSQRVGILAAILAKQANFSQAIRNHCQIAGMMSGLGELLVLSDTVPPSNEKPLPSPLLASYLLSLWSLPLPIIEAVRWHQCPSASGISGPSPLAVVHTAWSLLNAHENSQDISAEPPILDSGFLKDSASQSVVDDWIKQTTLFCKG